MHPPGSKKSETDIELTDISKASPSNLSRPNGSMEEPAFVYRPHHNHHHHANFINSKKHFRMLRYRELQNRVYNFMERPTSVMSVLYHSFVFLIILASLLLSILATVEQFQQNPAFRNSVWYMELLLIAVFSVEYVLRIWSCASHGTYSGWTGKVKFMKKPYMLIDIIVIFATIALISFHKNSDYLNISILRFLRFLQVLRILRLDRQRGAFKMVSQVVYDHRQELLTCWYMSFIILITCSFLVYLAEKASPSSASGKIQNLAEGIYWGVISLLTIGYGDLAPQTWVAKLITCCFSLIGTAFFALPAGILGSGFALQVANQQRNKHITNRRIPAAMLIQCCWRRYAVDPTCGLHATWIRYLQMSNMNNKRKAPKPASSPSVTLDNKRISTIKKRLLLARSSSIGEKYRSQNSESETKEEINNQFSMPNIDPRTLRAVSDGDLNFIEHNTTDEDDNQSTVTSLPSVVGYYGPRKGSKGLGDLWTLKRELTSTERIAIRFILEVQFEVSVKKFKEARRPYDVKDVIEQYTAGQMEMFGYIKKLQSRIETVLGFEDEPETDVAKFNVIRRLNKLEKKVECIDKKLDLVIRMLHDDKSRSGGARSSSFNNTFLSPLPRGSHEKLPRDIPRSPALSKLDSSGKKKRSRFNVTIVDTRDLETPPSVSVTPTSGEEREEK
eukprot:gene11877-13110_t